MFLNLDCSFYKKQQKYCQSILVAQKLWNCKHCNLFLAHHGKLPLLGLLNEALKLYWLNYTYWLFLIKKTLLVNTK